MCCDKDYGRFFIAVEKLEKRVHDLESGETGGGVSEKRCKEIAHNEAVAVMPTDAHIREIVDSEFNPVADALQGVINLL